MYVCSLIVLSSNLIAYFSTTKGNLFQQVSQKLSYNQNNEFETFLWQVRNVKSCEKQSNQKDDRIYNLYQFHTFLFKGLKQSLRNNFEPTNNLQVNSKGNMQVCKKTHRKNVCLFFSQEKSKYFFNFVVISQRQAKLSRFGDLKTVNYK